MCDLRRLLLFPLSVLLLYQNGQKKWTLNQRTEINGLYFIHMLGNTFQQTVKYLSIRQPSGFDKRLLAEHAHLATRKTCLADNLGSIAPLDCRLIVFGGEKLTFAVIRSLTAS